MTARTTVIPFTGENFRKFVVGSMLQTFKFPSNSTNTNTNTNRDFSEDRMTAIQLALSKKWKVEHEPFDANNTKAFYRRMAEFAVASQPLPADVLDVLKETFRELSPSSSSSSSQQLDPGTAAGMRKILECCGFMKEGDNLHRLVASHRIELPETVHRFVDDYVNPADPFDELRVIHTHNVFAIDSATTSEVDDAIGIRTCDKTGNEIITVYVADATVHCPIFSELEQFSARALTTTTYLPEGVFFMLPHKITEAATLRPDRPCRTFNINFTIDKESGELRNYNIEVGWCHALRRITYDQTQELLETGARAPLPSSPSWMSADDCGVIQRIHEIAVLRYKAREKRSKGFTGSTPDPLIIVEGVEVKEVKDQIICTKDARLAVAELMIAANEVCSLVAQAHKVVVPFRGSRPLSTVHEAAAGGELQLPLGYAALPSQDPTISFFARTLVGDMERLRGVTRAYYAHFPVYHNGLDTHNYCHSTSPLRRYPDMLVHHQLKTIVARDHGKAYQDLIPEFEMIKLCSHCSNIQARGKVMQIKSDRFWILKYLQAKKTKMMMNNDSNNNNVPLQLRCFVGGTEYIRGCPEADRRMSAAFAFRSDVYIPEVQMVHSVYHNRSDMLVGVTCMCNVLDIDPYLDRMVLEVDSIQYEKDVQQALSKVVTLIADS